MCDDLQNARQLLDAGDYTCALCKGSRHYTSTQRGVAPLLSWLDAELSLHGFSAADRVVGKATAFLYCLLGVQQVYARVMSKPALEVLQQHRIAASWGTLVDSIENRQKNGPCPMEHATRGCTTPEEALEAIRATLKRLQTS